MIELIRKLLAIVSLGIITIGKIFMIFCIIVFSIAILLPCWITSIIEKWL